MRNNKRFIAAMACVMVMGLTACGSGAECRPIREASTGCV